MLLFCKSKFLLLLQSLLMTLLEASTNIEISLEAFLAIISAAVGLVLWHFKEVGKVKGHIQKTDEKYRNEIHKLEMKMKELESKDALQQQALDQLDKLYPIINKVIGKLPDDKK